MKKKNFVQLHLLEVVLGLVALVLLSIEGILLSIIINYGNTLSNDVTIQKIGLFVLGIVTLTIIVYLAMYVYDYIQLRVVKNTMVRIKNKYLNNAITHNYNADTVMSFLNNDLKLFETKYLNSLFDIAKNIAIAIVAFGAMVLINPVIAFIFLVFSFFPGYVIKLIREPLNKKTANWKASSEELVKYVNNTVHGSHVINLYQVLNYHFGRLKKVVEHNEENYFKMNLYVRFANLLVYLVSIISFIIPFGVGIWYSNYVQHVSFVAIITLFFLNDRVLGPIRACLNAFTQLKQADNVKKKIVEELAVEENTAAEVLYNKPTLSLKNITYKIGDRVLFDDVSLTVPYGQKVLIVGDSGSGKTTLLRMISNQIHDYEGEIILEDQEQTLENSFQCYSYIEQSSHIFYDTVENNVTFTKATFDEQLLADMKFHHDMNYECDENLSGGEKQKVGIVRAITQNRKIILADEITSALDSEVAKLIRANLYKNPQTIIEIAHHYDEGFEQYDAVYQLENGKLNQLK